MIFSEKSITNIINNKKTQTRRLVKEEDYLGQYTRIDGNKPDDFCIVDAILTSVGRVKHYVGQKRSIQAKRGGHGIWYCPKCGTYSSNKIKDFIHPSIANQLLEEDKIVETDCTEKMIPLRIRITAIRKEKLVDITEEDAKKEGYKGKVDFLDAFYWINKKWTIAQSFRKAMKDDLWNPSVWVISFEKVD